jgi:hypothetical protein
MSKGARSAMLPRTILRNESSLTGTNKVLNNRLLCVFICLAIMFLITFQLLVTICNQHASNSTVIGPVSAVATIKPPFNKTGIITISSIPDAEELPVPERELTPLRPIDVEFYTIRMNTWRRPEQLLTSVAHHSTCPGVKQIQIIWCDKDNQPPKELDRFEKVVIEYHEANTLNERFNILESTPTLGILSIDDDVLRPCDAIDSGFFQWVKSPHRMVGFDARTHVENGDGTWGYGYLS